MENRTDIRNRFNWWLPLFAAIATFSLFGAVVMWTAERLVYALFVVPLMSLLLASVIAATVKKGGRLLPNLSILVSYWVISTVLVMNYSAIRTDARWLIWSHVYKSEVLSQPASTTGDLKHIEWDGWGWAGMDTSTFLVFDPTDSLRQAAKGHRPGKFNGIPCEAPVVRRLESQWYSVQYYTDVGWNDCP